jgi:hypothetical protein
MSNFIFDELRTKRELGYIADGKLLKIQCVYFYAVLNCNYNKLFIEKGGLKKKTKKQ